MDGIQNFFLSLEGVGGYLFLFLSSMCENLFPPMPGDTFVVLGAFLVGRGQMMFLPAYIATTMGSLTGFMLMYSVGLFYGRRFFDRRGGRFFSKERLERLETWFDRYGFGIIAVNRFLSGFRSIVAIGAGVAKMRWGIVFVLGLVSCLLWNGLLMGAGIWIGENWKTIVKNYQIFTFSVICLILIVVCIKKRIRRKDRR